MYSDLRHFAKAMLAGNRLRIEPDLSRIRAFRGALEVILYREGCWQVELVAGLPGTPIPQHRHLRVDSYELCLGGSVDAAINGIAMKNAQRGSLCANLIRIPLGAWHGGDAGANGVVFLSFQKWQGEPSFISDDWHE
jgi:quercetin dioxygenase-like cupin family protein